MKRENKKVKKDNLIEITGNRTELEELLNKELKVEGFVTNTIGFVGGKRLVTEVRIPGTNYFIKHLWFQTERIGKLKHGYQNLEVKVVKYKDYVSGENKYGLKYIGKKGRVPYSNKIKIPKWKKDDWTKETKRSEEDK